MSRFDRNMVLGGLGGLFACGMLAALSTWLVSTGIITPLLPYRGVSILFVLILGGFSLAEIPVMVLAMRRLAGEQRENQAVVWGLNALYVSFAAVYGIPVSFLTGSTGWGLALCGLSLLRLAASLTFVREPAQ